MRGGKWSLLVQGVNHVLPAAQRLLRQFAFIPYARLDDVMVSFAPPGGGVGPHFDSYDVFLAAGQRVAALARRAAAATCELVPDAPLRILRRFRPRHEWVLHPGDMLYLPPHYGHDGVALTDCITYSIGFRAPRRRGARQRASWSFCRTGSGSRASTRIRISRCSAIRQSWRPP